MVTHALLRWQARLEQLFSPFELTMPDAARTRSQEDPGELPSQSDSRRSNVPLNSNVIRSQALVPHSRGVTSDEGVSARMAVDAPAKPRTSTGISVVPLTPLERVGSPVRRVATRRDR